MKHSTITDSRQAALAIVIVALAASCKTEERQDSAVVTTGLATLSILKEADDAHDANRVKPRLAHWQGTEINLTGITDAQVDEFFVWSVADSKLLWWLRPKHRRKDYSKKSRAEQFSFSFGNAPPEWKQRYPSGTNPVLPKKEILLVYFHYSFPFMFGMRGESEIYYVDLRTQPASILGQAQLDPSSFVTLKEHQTIWEPVNKDMHSRRFGQRPE